MKYALVMMTLLLATPALAQDWGQQQQFEDEQIQQQNEARAQYESELPNTVPTPTYQSTYTPEPSGVGSWQPSSVPGVYGYDNN